MISLILGTSCVPLVDAMKFRSWLDEIQPTELRGSPKEALVLSFSPTTTQEKWALLCPKPPFCSILTLSQVPGPRRVTCPPLVRVYLYPKMIYFILVQVQIILNELYLDYFPKSLFFFFFLPNTRRPEICEKSDCLKIQQNSSR